MNIPSPALRSPAILAAVTAGTLLAAAGHSLAIDKHWNAAAGTWSTGANWSPVGMPAPADRVFIGDTVAALNATCSLNVNATVAAATITDGMRLNTGVFQLTVTGDTLVTGRNDLPNNVVAPSGLAVLQGPAATDCSLNNLTVSDGASVSIYDGATLRVSGLLLLDDASLNGGGIVNLTGNGVTSLRMDGGLGAAVEGLTINQLGSGKIDLDGTTAGDNVLNLTLARIDGTAFAHLTINGTELLDAFDDDLWIGGQNVLTMNLSNGWTMGTGAELAISGNFSHPGPAQINGGQLTFNGSMRFIGTNAHAQFNAPVIVNPSAQVVLTPSDYLEFNNTTTVNGGSYVMDQFANIDFDGATLVRGGSFQTFSNLQADGDVNFRGTTQWFGDVAVLGVARQTGNASVIGATTILAQIFDMDGESGNTSWTIGSALNITADRINTTNVYNGFYGTLSVGGGVLARLTMNMNPGGSGVWANFGSISLSGDANLFFTRLSGSRLNQFGNLTIGGKVISTAEMIFGDPSVNTFTNANSVLRLTSLTRVYPDATFVGSGTLHAASGGASIALSHAANLASTGLINDGTLTLGYFPETAGRATVARYTSSPSAIMIADIGGYTAGTLHDRLDVSMGVAHVAGELVVNIIDAGPGLFHPLPGDMFTIVTGRQGVTGTFANDPVTVSDGAFYHWTVLYGPDTVTLRLDEVIPVPCAADFNADGGIDGTDVQAFFDAWGNGDPAADVNLDGGVDGADVAAFFEVWEAGGC